MDSRRCISDISGILERDAKDRFAIPAALAALEAEARTREVVLRCFYTEIVICDTVVEEDEASPGLMVTADGEAILHTGEPAFIARKDTFLVSADTPHAAQRELLRRGQRLEGGVLAVEAVEHVLVIFEILPAHEVGAVVRAIVILMVRTVITLVAGDTGHKEPEPIFIKAPRRQSGLHRARRAIRKLHTRVCGVRPFPMAFQEDIHTGKRRDIHGMRDGNRGIV